jgi:hypothetical protein
MGCASHRFMPPPPTATASRSSRTPISTASIFRTGIAMSAVSRRFCHRPDRPTQPARSSPGACRWQHTGNPGAVGSEVVLQHLLVPGAATADEAQAKLRPALFEPASQLLVCAKPGADDLVGLSPSGCSDTWVPPRFNRRWPTPSLRLTSPPPISLAATATPARPLQSSPSPSVPVALRSKPPGGKLPSQLQRAATARAA